MYLLDNPILQRELVVHLRSTRSFGLLFAYVALLGLLVLAAWPSDARLDMAHPEAAKRLVGLFFLGQYVFMSLMAPSFAAGAIAGEKERKSFEMLIASPLKPRAILLGKLVAALCQLAIMIFASLPIVMLCLPLGGVSPYEVVAVFIAMFTTVSLFGMISLWCSSYFRHTSAALVVSYLMILPLALSGILAWVPLGQLGGARPWVMAAVVPLASGSIAALLWGDACKRLIRSLELGSEGKQAIDLETEAQEAVGLTIDRSEFPDRLFAPPKRTTLLPESANPIYDKEVRGELFSQGTLMLRFVIQLSWLLALPLMAICLFFKQHLVPWYIAYVLLFNMLIGPVFSAGSYTSERERQTLDMLLTTLITPWQMLWGKLLSSLRVSSVLTSFLLWPVLLACIMPLDFWHNLPTMGGYFVVCALTALMTAMTGLCASTLLDKTSTSLMAAYLVIAALFLGPVAADFFATAFLSGTRAASLIAWSSLLSPLAAVFHLPLSVTDLPNAVQGNVMVFWGFLAFGLAYNGLLLLLMTWRRASFSPTPPFSAE